LLLLLMLDVTNDRQSSVGVVFVTAEINIGHSTATTVLAL